MIPRAALEVARRSEVKGQAIGWMLQTAAISPDPQKASGLLLRAANAFHPNSNLETAELSMGSVIQRIAFEEMAADRGNPIAKPDIWWEELKQRSPERTERTRMVVDSLKEKLEASLAERRTNAGFPNA